VGKIDSYCYSESLVAFMENPITNPVNSNYNDWAKTYEILANCKLLIDSKDKLLDHTNNPLILKLIKSSTTSTNRIFELPHFFNNILDSIEDIKNHSPLFFLNDGELPKILDFGYFLSDLNGNMSGVQTLFTSKTQSIRPKSNFQWTSFLPEVPPRNAAIIGDNYLLNNKNTYEYNLYPLLDFLVPKKLDIDFHLSIITKSDLNNLDAKYNLIFDYLKSINVNTKLNIYLTNLNQPHGRMIISNYFYIQSDHTFDIHNNKGIVNKESLISYKPICSEKDIQWYKDQLFKLSNYIYDAKHVGKNMNRLLVT